MKSKLHLLTILFFAFAIANTFGQIPNSGFENWTPVGNYDSLNSWGSTNAYCGGSFYPVTKSLDNYPVSIGTYSIRLENNISLLPPTSYCGLGVAGSGTKFPITGHPTSLTGYYKFLPQNGDTMIISLQLFNSGTQVSNAAVETAVASPNWTSFNIPFYSYTAADSGSIRVSAYCTCGPQNVPYGNSVLYVDNLNFDNLVSGISEESATKGISAFPNPFSTQTVIQMDDLLKDATLAIYNSQGQTVKQLKNIFGYTVTLLRDNLPSGLYFVRLTENNKTIAADKLLIID